jgi:hypothetical protein
VRRPTSHPKLAYTAAGPAVRAESAVSPGMERAAVRSGSCMLEGMSVLWHTRLWAAAHTPDVFIRLMRVCDSGVSRTSCTSGVPLDASLPPAAAAEAAAGQWVRQGKQLDTQLLRSHQTLMAASPPNLPAPHDHPSTPRPHGRTLVAHLLPQVECGAPASAPAAAGAGAGCPGRLSLCSSVPCVNGGGCFTAGAGTCSMSL